MGHQYKEGDVTPLEELPTAELLRIMNAADYRAVEAVGSILERVSAVAEAAAEALGAGGRLIFVGAGTSGRLGVLEAAECPPTFGIDPGRVVGVIAGGVRAMRGPEEGAEDNGSEGRKVIEKLDIGAGDLVVGIAASGTTPFTLAAVEEARTRGARTAAVVNVEQSPLAATAEMAVEASTGAEVLAGSTRLKAGSAQKMVLNMISTAAMVRLGYTYKNLMVGVTPHNAKLKQRAVRIVREITGCTDGEARSALEAAGYHVRIAVLLVDGAPSVEEARRRLEKAGGSLRKARQIL